MTNLTAFWLINQKEQGAFTFHGERAFSMHYIIENSHNYKQNPANRKI
jgi:hypothetical protein